MSEKIHLTPQVQSRPPELEEQNVTRFCPKCGREIPLNRQICAFCENDGSIPLPRRSGREKLKIAAAILLLLLLLLLAAVLFADNLIPAEMPKADLTPIPRGTSVPVRVLP